MELIEFAAFLYEKKYRKLHYIEVVNVLLSFELGVPNKLLWQQALTQISQSLISFENCQKETLRYKFVNVMTLLHEK